MTLSPYFGAIVSVIVVAAVLVLNTWAYLDRVPNNSISAWVTHGGDLAAALPWALGVIAGHWCSRDMSLPLDTLLWGPWALLVIFGIMLAIDWQTGGRLSVYPFLFWLIAGIPTGAMLWPMARIAT